MKKLALTIAIVLGIGLCSYAQYGGGLFGYGEVAVDEEEDYTSSAWYSLDQDEDINLGLFTNLRGIYKNGDTPGLPNHGEDGNQDAPLGSGALLLIGFGAAYALKKRKK